MRCSPETRACSAARERSGRPNASHRPWRRRTPWLRRSSRDGGCSCCWRRGQVFAGGELVALRRCSVDLDQGRLTVADQLVETQHERHLGSPKTDAGRRTVYLPPHLVPELLAHLDRWVGPGPDAWLFCGPLGAPLARRNFTGHWTRARAEAGLPHVRFHDLRHLSATLAAATGATTRELMARMGHSSPRAALIYQHTTADRDRAVAVAMSGFAAAAAVAPVVAPPATRSRSSRRVDSSAGQLALDLGSV
jgi:integrase